MTVCYFELENDRWLPGRWHLNGLFDDAGVELDGREFTYGVSANLNSPLMLPLWNDNKPVQVKPPLHVRLDPRRPGKALDFTYTNDAVPVATAEVGRLLATLGNADIQRVSVQVQSQQTRFEIINIATSIDCLDRTNSDVQWFEKGNSIRPDLAGEPEMVLKLVVDPDRVQGHHIFRIKGWPIPIIVSEVVKRLFEEHKVSGVKFRPVSP